jgi:ribosomal protein S18 acetylase RimI-like enzyme
VIHNNKVIGCGRVIGDGGFYYYIQYVIVLPEFQKRGLGKLIMDSIMKFFNEIVQPNTFIGLMAAKGQSKVYKQFGFNERLEYRPGL